MTLLQLRDAAKDLCDHQNNPNVADATWTRWINDGIQALYEIAVKRNAGAFQTFANFTLTSASNLFTLTAGWRRVIGVTMDPTNPTLRRSLQKFNFGERDSLGLLGPRMYRVVSSTQLAIEPAQLCAGNYRLHYVAAPTILAADGDLLDTILEPFDDYVTMTAAYLALRKEESSTTDIKQDLKDRAAEVDEFFAMLDGDDPSAIVDDDERGPSIWSV